MSKMSNIRSVSINNKMINMIIYLLNNNNLYELNNILQYWNNRIVKINPNRRLNNLIKNLFLQKDYDKINYFCILGYVFNESFFNNITDLIKNALLNKDFFAINLLCHCNFTIQYLDIKVFQDIIAKLLVNNKNFLKLIDTGLILSTLSDDTIFRLIVDEFYNCRLCLNISSYVYRTNIDEVIDSIKKELVWKERINYLKLIEGTIIHENDGSFNKPLYKYILSPESFFPHEICSYL